MSVIFALIAAIALGGSGGLEGVMRVLALIGAALAIQLRLLCNLFDGMMAVEGGMKSPVGDIYNDLPDRLADPIILIAAGCAARHLDYGLTLGWTAALLSLMTAYVRMLGAAGGLPHDYAGPMAKQHRMAIMTVACIVATLEPLRELEGQTMRAALAIIVVGCVITVIRRTLRMSRVLRARTKDVSP